MWLAEPATLQPTVTTAAGGTPLPQGVPASFAEGDLSAAPLPDDPLNERLASAGDLVLAAWMQQIRKLVGAADSPAALRDSLLAAYGDLPTEQLTEVMTLAFAAAELAGRYNAATESGQAA